MVHRNMKKAIQRLISRPVHYVRRLSSSRLTYSLSEIPGNNEENPLEGESANKAEVFKTPGTDDGNVDVFSDDGNDEQEVSKDNDVEEDGETCPGVRSTETGNLEDVQKEKEEEEEDFDLFTDDESGE